MQKIKYIIIFTLTLALGMLYIQLSDYQKITSTLLENNSKNKNNTTELQNKIIFLETENLQLLNTIITLEETLALTQIQNNNNYTNDNNQSINYPMDIEPLNNERNETIPEINLTPNISIDEENEVSGFGLEYTQKF